MERSQTWQAQVGLFTDGLSRTSANGCPSALSFHRAVDSSSSGGLLGQSHGLPFPGFGARNHNNPYAHDASRRHMKEDLGKAAPTTALQRQGKEGVTFSFGASSNVGQAAGIDSPSDLGSNLPT